MPRGRLLILDDDAMVGQLLVFVAQSAGFEARQCDEAKAFFDAVAEWQPTHVAIDLSMPGTSGAEVLRSLAGVGCGAKVIISSGASRSELEDALLEAHTLGLATAGILPKPFSLAAMRTLLAADDDHPAAHDTTGAT